MIYRIDFRYPKQEAPSTFHVQASSFQEAESKFTRKMIRAGHHATIVSLEQISLKDYLAESEGNML